MPNILEIQGYKIYFWSNEGYEPIHVHISKGNPETSSTKVWLTKSGRCMVANNKGNIPATKLRALLRNIENNYFFIIEEWKKYFDVEEVNFYC